MCNNYPKGHKEFFHKWIQSYHPVELILFVNRASGYRLYLAVEESGLVYMNRSYWIELLDKRLWTPRDNILQYNISIILSSLEVTALEHLCVIINITRSLTTSWLAGNYHILDGYNLCVLPMGRTVGELETSIQAIQEEGDLILKE